MTNRHLPTAALDVPIGNVTPKRTTSLRLHASVATNNIPCPDVLAVVDVADLSSHASRLRVIVEDIEACLYTLGWDSIIYVL